MKQDGGHHVVKIETGERDFEKYVTEISTNEPNISEKLISPCLCPIPIDCLETVGV